MQKKSFFSPGKLMVTGEYVVLNGAKSLAVPTGNFGQFLEVKPNEAPFHRWESYENETCWFRAHYSPDLNNIVSTNDSSKALFLQKILQFIYHHQKNLFDTPMDFTSYLNFNRDWGFGSSSTLLVLLYKWSGVNPFVLNKLFYGGSGYDIAVGMENKALIYQLKEHFHSLANAFPAYEDLIGPTWETINELDYPFKEDLKLVYLNKKQKSSEEVKKFNKKSVSNDTIQNISKITEDISKTTELSEFKNLLDTHEQLMAAVLGRPTIKEELFPDFDGVIKSLGAWGGDFVLAMGKNTQNYFMEKGYKTIISFDKILI